MTKRDENKLTMYESVRSFFKKFINKLVSKPALQRAADDLGAKITELKKSDTKKVIVKAGKTKDKRSAAKKLIDLILAVASDVYAWAVDTNNNEVKEITNVRRSYLQLLRDTDLLSKAELIYNTTMDHLNDLADYGVNGDTTGNFRGGIDRYGTALGVNELGSAERVSAGASVKILFREADSILKDRIDRMMESFQQSDPDFYNTYKAARVIKDL